MNTTIKFERQIPEFREVLKKTSCIDGREWDIKERLEKIEVRCGPYDNSDLIVIEQDMETHEFRVLFYSDSNGEEDPECVLSVMEEQP